ncbi:hypothetical protein WG936_05480 [Corynebacterium sp. H127]|uniref:hypothetical protein n=1 Tax=Corynebacterium sp. H127 TaxID=3133418 RepID=UPI0030A7DC54
MRQQSLQSRAELAHQIAEAARANAPVLTGEYASGIGVEISGTQVSVVDNDETAIHKEYGTSDTPAHAALTSAAMAFGRYSGMRPRRRR